MKFGKPIFLFIFLGVSFTSRVSFSEKESLPSKFIPSKVEIDRNYDGKIDRREFYQGGKIKRVESDTNFDGIFDEIVYFDDKGKPVKAEKDTNSDGKVDTWVTY